MTLAMKADERNSLTTFALAQLGRRSTSQPAAVSPPRSVSTSPVM